MHPSHSLNQKWSSLVKFSSKSYHFIFVYYGYYNTYLFTLKDGMRFLPGIGQKQTRMIFVAFVKLILNVAVLIANFQEINVL